MGFLGELNLLIHFPIRPPDHFAPRIIPLPWLSKYSFLLGLLILGSDHALPFHLVHDSFQSQREKGGKREGEAVRYFSRKLFIFFLLEYRIRNLQLSIFRAFRKSEETGGTNNLMRTFSLAFRSNKVFHILTFFHPLLNNINLNLLQSIFNGQTNQIP